MFTIKCRRSSILCAVLMRCFFGKRHRLTFASQTTGDTLRVVFGEGRSPDRCSWKRVKASSHSMASAVPSSLQVEASARPLAASTSVLRGTALNLNSPADLAGTYTLTLAVVAHAVAAGVSAVKLRNDKGRGA